MVAASSRIHAGSTRLKNGGRPRTRPTSDSGRPRLPVVTPRFRVIALDLCSVVLSTASLLAAARLHSSSRPVLRPTLVPDTNARRLSPFGSSRYAFVEFRDERCAEDAYFDMHGRSIDRRRIGVQVRQETSFPLLLFSHPSDIVSHTFLFRYSGPRLLLLPLGDLTACTAGLLGADPRRTEGLDRGLLLPRDESRLERLLERESERGRDRPLRGRGAGRPGERTELGVPGPRATRTRSESERKTRAGRGGRQARESSERAPLIY